MWKIFEVEYGDKSEIYSWLSFFEYLVVNNVEENIDYLYKIIIDECSFWGKEEDFYDLDRVINVLFDCLILLILCDFLLYFVNWLEKYEVNFFVFFIEYLMFIFVMDEKNVLEDLLLCNSMFDLLFS